jgi:hypothetical protein
LVLGGARRSCRYRWDVGSYGSTYVHINTTTTPTKALPLTPELLEVQTYTMAPSDLPKNAHVSTHPCLLAKLSQLRSAKTGCREAQTLVHEIALMVGYEALGAGLSVQENGTVRPLIARHPSITRRPHFPWTTPLTFQSSIPNPMVNKMLIEG